MKMNIEYTLPDDQYDLDNALRANKMRSAIDEVLERVIRPVLKHGSPSDETRDILERIRVELFAGLRHGDE